LTFLNPLPSNLSIYELDDNITFNITITDENLYSFFINISNSTNLLFNFSTIALNGLTTYTFGEIINFTGWGIGFYSVSVGGCDGHTEGELKGWYVEHKPKSVKYNNEVEIGLLNDNATITTKFNKDRYAFKVSSEENIGYIELLITSKSYIDIVSTEYLGHLITSNYWIDFENDNVDTLLITRINATSLRVEIWLKNPKKTINFNSIGALNCVAQTVLFEIEERFAFEFERFECDTSTTGKAIVFAGFVIFVVLLWIFCMYINISVLSMIMG
ncbi:unnamed protein product, partial [marine sediment metagenome]